MPVIILWYLQKNLNGWLNKQDNRMEKTNSRRRKIEVEDNLFPYHSRHRVSAEYDSGEIVAQTKVPVLENDTPEILAARVLETEHEFLVVVFVDIVNGKIALGKFLRFELMEIKCNES